MVSVFVCIYIIKNIFFSYQYPHHHPHNESAYFFTHQRPRHQKLTQLAMDHWGPKSYKLELLQGIFQVGIIIGQLMKLWIIKRDNHQNSH
ncbi:hypothetical protein HanXRQr2_Chr01g0025311 [Helianthus annuus]|uniref:Uncharacterized protein n=1 Tax=Helianthus annuus TaxID=4232 RepID=A0A9K3P4S5_HELAN|nr:hypothetical protein HanXRQr2_Chr01g0025311 [Helianthus annuus]KAJ0957197.1 hypothetical protein HanPSC8_Chr01g0024411 [Helianthus annuus]